MKMQEISEREEKKELTEEREGEREFNKRI